MLLCRALYLVVCLTTSVPYILQSYWLTRGVNDVDGLVGVIETIAETWQPGEKLVLSRLSISFALSTTDQFAPAQLLPWLQKLDSMTSFTEAAIKAFECHLAMILLVTLVRALTLFSNL